MLFLFFTVLFIFFFFFNYFLFYLFFFFFFSSRRRHTRWNYDWSSDVCSSDLRKEPMSTHPELSEEQAYLARAYEHLAAMRGRTEAAASIEEGATSAVDSAIAQAHLRARLRSEERRVGKEWRSRVARY